MRYTVNAEQFLELPVTTGTVQNISNTDIEVSNEEVVGSGLILKAGEMVGFNNTTVYVCARPVLEGGTGIISVVPFSIKGEGGGGGSYVLSVATTSKLGGVKANTADGGVSVASDGKMTINLPTADTTTKGGIKVGTGVEVDANQKLNVTVGTESVIGGVKSSITSGNIKINLDGTMTYNAPEVDPISAPTWETGTTYSVNALVEYDGNVYLCLTAHTSGVFADDLAGGKWKLVSMTLQTATSSTLGGVKSSSAFGKVSVNSDGTMSMNGNPNDGTPTGTVISFFGLTPPTGYLTCDGTAYNIADYQALADHINNQFGSYNYFGGDGITTFAVPDLRGEFLRGTGTNSHTNQGSGSSVGEHQDGTEHSNVYVDGVASLVGPGTGIDTTDDRRNGNNYKRDSVITAFSSPSLRYQGLNNITGSIIPSHYTSRPTNTSVLYCIKC